jgi:hypothetical protein
MAVGHAGFYSEEHNMVAIPVHQRPMKITAALEIAHKTAQDGTMTVIARSINTLDPFVVFRVDGAGTLLYRQHHETIESAMEDYQR